MSEDYDLKVSIKNMGVLVPIIKNKRTGHTVDGKHRSDIDPEAPVYEIDIPEELEPLARLAINRCRRDADQNEEEWRDILGKVVGIQGKKPQEIADQTGISLSTIYRHLPQEMKPSGEKISEGLTKAYDVARQAVATTTLNSKTSDTMSNLVECDNCHMATHIIKMKALDDKDLCPACFNRLSKLPKVTREQVSEKHSEPVKESWEQRKAVMTPSISKMDEQVYLVLQNNKVLRDAGWKFEFQKHYCLKEVISDTTATKGDVEKPLFFDGDVHIGKEDRDDVNRGLLARRLKSAEVLTFAYSGEYSDVKRDMMASKIEKSLLEILAVVKTEV
jgi:hypothetical protein